MVREPAVAGQFYTADKKRLEKELQDMMPDCASKISAIGAVCPHAGYIYSGAVAGEVYSKIQSKSTYIIISPNHTGYGSRFASSTEPWHTPLGDVDVDNDLLSSITEKTALVKEDKQAHMFEHSIEVQLPFVQKTSPESRIVPLTVMHGSLSEYQEVAEAITKAIAESKKDVMIIASSDMTHFESRESAKEKDQAAIEKVLGLDAEGLLNTVEEKGISMCGYIPTAIMLIAAKSMGARKAELIKYADSGDITGDTVQVVGYAGIIVY